MQEKTNQLEDMSNIKQVQDKFFSFNTSWSLTQLKSVFVSLGKDHNVGGRALMVGAKIGMILLAFRGLL